MEFEIGLFTHLLFVDDLKLYASNLNQNKLQLDLVTQFSKDIGMEFGEDKCGYMYIERRNSKLSVASCQLSVASCQLISVSCQLVSVSCYFASDKYFVYCWPNSHVLRH